MKWHRYTDFSDMSDVRVCVRSVGGSGEERGRSRYLLGPKFGLNLSPTHWKVAEGRCETGTRERGRPDGTAFRDTESRVQSALPKPVRGRPTLSRKRGFSQDILFIKSLCMPGVLKRMPHGGNEGPTLGTESQAWPKYSGHGRALTDGPFPTRFPAKLGECSDV